MASTTTHRPYEFVANHLALDLVNTVDARPRFTRDDLRSVEHLVEWATLAGVLADADFDADGADLESVLDLRESLYEVFGPLAAGGTPDKDALRHVVATSALAAQSAEWTRSGPAFEVSWPAHSAESVVHRLADAAVQLLRSPSLARLGACDGCGWLFLDTSRAGARRWCSMNACGARHKMRRYHERRSPRSRR